MRSGFDRSPMFNGAIQSTGPVLPFNQTRSVDLLTKIVTKSLVEPEGWNTIEYYINGFSTSLPQDVQFQALRKVKGFENVKFFRPGYAM